MSSPDVIQLDPSDNVCVALRDLAAGDVIRAAAGGTRVAEPVRHGHKLAVAPIEPGQAVTKYGHPIGRATRAIRPGQWVHTHNLAVGQSPEWLTAGRVVADPVRGPGDATFLGYRRENGTAGTRNYVAILSTVNCSATVTRAIAQHFDQAALEPFANVDGVVALTHDGGCAIPFGGPQHQLLNRVVGGMARHPNFAAALVVGLGCEQAGIESLLEGRQLVTLGATPSGEPPVATLGIQACGGTRRTIEAGVRRVAELLPVANDVQRVPIPLSELILATQCGGSDAYSGITANAALGVASDLLVAAGGTTVLAETPEIYGAESLLAQRASSPAVAKKLLDRIDWWQQYVARHGAVLDNNPSIGNKRGGLTTIWEKSLGAIAKGGSTPLRDVVLYAERIVSRGLVVMDTPGYDPVSVTGLVAGGAQVVAFTTGRGSCFGCRPAPSIKIASNSPMYVRMADDMDINAGTILEGKTVRQVGQEIFAEIVAVASGRRTRSEGHGMGELEYVPWNMGPVL